MTEAAPGTGRNADTAGGGPGAARTTEVSSDAPETARSAGASAGAPARRGGRHDAIVVGAGHNGLVAAA